MYIFKSTSGASVKEGDSFAWDPKVSLVKDIFFLFVTFVVDHLKKVLMHLIKIDIQIINYSIP